MVLFLHDWFSASENDLIVHSSFFSLKRHTYLTRRDPLSASLSSSILYYLYYFIKKSVRERATSRGGAKRSRLPRLLKPRVLFTAFDRGMGT
jgi:hypothetical protein